MHAALVRSWVGWEIDSRFISVEESHDWVARWCGMEVGWVKYDSCVGRVELLDSLLEEDVSEVGSEVNDFRAYAGVVAGR
eukprot:109007-Pyramimonas_sp.AAC.1